MEQLIHAFGIDVRLIIIQVINFVVLMGILTYFLYKPVLKLLAEREEKIAQGIQDAEAAAASRSDAEKEKQAILATAESDAKTVADNARAYAKEQSEAIVAEARQKADGMIADATMKGDELKAKAKKESEAEIAKLAILAAEKVLSQKT